MLRFILLGHRSRYSHSITFRQVSTSWDYYKFSFFPLAIVQWTSLPEPVACLQSLQAFKLVSSSCKIPKMYSLLKNSKMDSKGSALLKQNGQLYTSTTDKTNILKQQSQSVFTPKTPLKLSQLTRMLVQDFVDDVILNPSHIPSKTLSSVPQMPNIIVSLNGVLKLLKDLNLHKAAGPDQLKSIVLQRLRDVIAPVLQVTYQKSLDTGRVSAQ